MNGAEGMKVNADKCGVRHIRRGLKRQCPHSQLVETCMVRAVQSYRYLGCIVNEHIDCI